MYELTKDGIISFLRDKGGRCLNAELSAQFKVFVVFGILRYFWFSKNKIRANCENQRAKKLLLGLSTWWRL